ncbi:hypothetical protein AB835_05625 [Candidatus Endobugula sertula]|uniref:Aminoacyl-transfer RNA synthetases class-II family profile domain-containing protein n=1 Tax=Candidatus Endobugula sertula TaxID=62101 RepID=A0A1D2QR87_9GAMM|nr:hypothetical protein AB835_05625 [Candidatus Endobugula sertula]
MQLLLGEMGYEVGAIQHIQSVVLSELQNYANQHGFKQIMPLLLSPITDPLNHSVYSADIKYEEKNLKLTASMIFHKQLALMSPSIEKLYIVSPNIRLEKRKVKSSSNHLLEFSQFDMEIQNASMHEVMDFVEMLFKHTIKAVKAQCESELQLLGRELLDWDEPFERITTIGDSRSEDEICQEVTNSSSAPAFVTSFKKEFYDLEDPNAVGIYRNFDLIYPEGYGESLSGAEREYEYNSIVRRMEELGMDFEPYENYLSLAKLNHIPKTAGGGLGIQRLIKFITGKRNIADVCLFDRSVESPFTF